jgi:hypothetical protein
MSYICVACNQEHSGPPLAWGPAAPDAWTQLAETERAERGEISSDQCVIDDLRFFVLGRLEIPVVRSEDIFAWLVWVEVKPNDFFDISEKWNLLGRENTPPYDAALANQLGLYEGATSGLQIRLHTRPIGDRPSIEVLGSHQLADEQKNGITEARVQEIAHLLTHVSQNP